MVFWYIQFPTWSRNRDCKESDFQISQDIKNTLDQFPLFMYSSKGSFIYKVERLHFSFIITTQYLSAYSKQTATDTSLMATGRPVRSAMAMSLLPLPRLVGPTSAPPFSPARRYRR